MELASIEKLKLHEDERGTLFEMIRFDEEIPNTGQFYCFTLKPGATRGNHYHKLKTEWFVCIKGAVSLLIKDESGCQNLILDSTKPSRIKVAPNQIHTLKNKNSLEAIMISYSSKVFDGSNPDTYPG